MIRLGKEIQLCEWGVGTSTVTQTGTQLAQALLKPNPKTKWALP